MGAAGRRWTTRTEGKRTGRMCHLCLPLAGVGTPQAEPPTSPAALALWRAGAAEPAAGAGKEPLCSGHSGTGTPGLIGGSGTLSWDKEPLCPPMGLLHPCAYPPATKQSLPHHFTPAPVLAGGRLHWWDSAKVSWRAWGSQPKLPHAGKYMPITSSLCFSFAGGSSPFPSSTHRHPSYAKGQAKPPRAWKQR